MTAAGPPPGFAQGLWGSQAGGMLYTHRAPEDKHRAGPCALVRASVPAHSELCLLFDKSTWISMRPQGTGPRAGQRETGWGEGCVCVSAQMLAAGVKPMGEGSCACVSVCLQARLSAPLWSGGVGPRSTASLPPFPSARQASHCSVSLFLLTVSLT